MRFPVGKGADPHTNRDNKGWNPLHIASQNGYLNVVQLLPDAGTPVDIWNETQKTPLDSVYKSTSFPVHKPAFISCVESLHVFSPM